jgi:hypothetical protein
VSACLQVVEDTGEFAREDFTLTNKSPSKFSGNLAMVPVMASAPVISKGEEGSDCGLEGSKVSTTDTRIKSTMRVVPFCSLQATLRFGEEELPHALCTSGAHIEFSIAG